MSLRKKEKDQIQNLGKKHEIYPADSSKSLKNSDLDEIQKKFLQKNEELSFEGNSENPMEESEKTGKKGAFPGSPRNPKSQTENMFKCKLNKNFGSFFKFKFDDKANNLSIDDPKQQQLILHNLQTFMMRKKAGLLSPKNNKMQKNRKGNRVVSEGTKQIQISKKKEDELLLENDIFPSKRLGEPSVLNHLMKKQATHSRVSSAHLTSIGNPENELKSSRNGPSTIKKENQLKFNRPLNYKFETPVLDRGFSGKPPSLKRPSWQKKVRKNLFENGRSWEASSGDLFPLTPSKWFPNLQKRSLLEIEETCQENENNLRIKKAGDEREFEQNFSNFGMFSKKSQKGSFLTKNDDKNNNFEIRLDRFDALFAPEDPLGPKSSPFQNDIAALGTHSILNPNIINFEKNIFDDIFEAPGQSEFPTNPFGSPRRLGSESKKSKSSSNEHFG